MTVSTVKFGSGDSHAAASVRIPFSYCQSDPFDLTPVSFKDTQNGFGGAVLHSQSLSDQEGRLRNPAHSNAADVADPKVDELSSDDCHRSHPQLSAIQTPGQFPGSAAVGAL